MLFLIILMKSSYSVKLIANPSKKLSNAAKKHLNYFNPKGASNRNLPLNCRRTFLELAILSSKSFLEIQSPEKQETSENPKKISKPSKIHQDLVKSTQLLEKLDLVSSKKGSPIKLLPIASNHFARDFTPQPSLPRLEQLSEIVDSCEQISKFNKSDILIANDLLKENNGLFKCAEEYINERRNINTREKWNEYFVKQKPDRNSIDRIKQESFETAYFVERKLRKNTVTKLKEKIMPWKVISKGKK